MMLQQELLDPAAGTEGELHPRVPSPTFSDADLHFGRHWRSDPLARWDTLMSRSSRPEKNCPCSVASGLGSAGAGTSGGKPSGLPF